MARLVAIPALIPAPCFLAVLLVAAGLLHLRKISGWLLLAGLLGLAGPGWAAGQQPPALALSDTTRTYVLGPHLDWLADTRPEAEIVARSVTLAQARGDSLGGHFVPNVGETPRYTNPATVYWLRCRLQNQARPGVAWLLVWRYNSDVSELHLVADDGEVRHYTPAQGDWLLPRAAPGRWLSLALDLRPGHTYTAYWQLWGSRTSFAIQEKSSYLQTSRQEDVWTALYLGLLLGLAAYNLLLYFSVRDPAYIYYALFVVSFGLLQLNMMGYLTQYWASLAQVMPTSLYFVLLSTTCVLGIMVVRSFLDIRGPHSPPYLDRLLRALLPVALLPVVVNSFTRYWHLGDAFGLIYQLAPLTVSLGLLLIGLRQLWHGDRPARYYMAGWTLLIGAVVLYYLNVLGLVANSFWTMYGVRIASAAEAILLSLALAARINRTRQERQAAQQAALLAQESTVRALTEKDEVQRSANAALAQRANELQQAYAELQASLQTTGRLQEIDELKTRFFTNISHELRTPLTLILGPLEQLLDRPEAALLAHEHQLMHRHGQRLLVLLNQLLDIARLEAGQLRLHAAPTDLADFLRTRVAAFDSLARARGIALSVQAPEAGLTAWVDGDQLEKVLTNLLANALKFTAAGGTVRVQLQEEEDRALITVADTGCGIPAAHLPLIFDRFHQVDDSLSRRHDGSGIGLALVKELVALHRGTVHVASTEGVGTTFTLSLPLSAAHLRPEEMAPGGNEEAGMKNEEERTVHQEPPPENSSFLLPHSSLSAGEAEASLRPLVLVVDDQADMRAYVASCLATDYRIGLATDGADGLAQLAELDPDLIVSDVMMPGLDGLELCRRVKTDERSSHIPVVLLTARASDQGKLEGLELGADDYLTKPFRPQELRARVANLIAQRQLLRLRFAREVTLQPRDISITSADEAFLTRALAVVEQHLAEPEFDVETFAAALAMSRTQLYRKLKALTDQAPTDFVRTLRLRRAGQLLAGQAGNVAEVTYQVGFNNLSYFSKCFREMYGHAPSEHFGQAVTETTLPA